jgi:hypothetical protein
LLSNKVAGLVDVFVSYLWEGGIDLRADTPRPFAAKTFETEICYQKNGEKAIWAKENSRLFFSKRESLLFYERIEES